MDQTLRRRARQQNVSLNELVVEELSRAARFGEKRTYRSLKGIAGRWVEDPEFDRILEDQRRVD